ncbi:hypothetical protein evm_007114 [Chilo suppressalis]|nr:hypothetical protein evm_007114 [Chilo suppressalis]
MAKFLKSFFQTEKRSHSYEGSAEDDKTDLPPPMEGRRKLSVSRSGRMKQAQKKRLSLSLEIFGNDALQIQEKPKTLEYHVNSISKSPLPVNRRRRSGDSKISSDSEKNAKSEKSLSIATSETDAKQKRNIGEHNIEQKKTPEEEIDTAFEIIDKTLSA